MEQNDRWPSEKIRRTFHEYYIQQGHLIVSSFASDNNRIAFLHNPLTQFEHIILGATDLDPRSAFAIRKCISIGGDNNNIKRVGKYIKSYVVLLK